MTGIQEHGTADLQAVSSAMVKLHKEQFGRGPRSSRANFAGPDTLVCVLEDVLLPAELRMVQLGQQTRVREMRLAFQAATEADFVGAVEAIVARKVVAFASGLDPNANVAFETFHLEHRDQESDGNGRDPKPAAGIEPATS